MNAPSVAALIPGDGVLIRAASAAPLPPLDPTGDVFHDLASCLLEQQIHARSTKRVFARMLERAGIERLRPGDADRFAAVAFEGAAVSRAKRDAFAAAASAFAGDDTDWLSLPDAEVRRRLGALPGVGAWTADMVLLYTLGRPDIFPVRDYHLRIGMARLYGLADHGRTAAMREVADGWRPNRSLGVRTVLAWKDAQRRR